MKDINKVQFTTAYFSKNFDYKWLCEYWLPFSKGGNLLASILICVGIERYKTLSDEIDDQIEKLNKKFDAEENSEFSLKLAEKELDGSLLPYLSDNFTLVHTIKMNLYNCHLIYSKYNQTYYYLKFVLYWDDEDEKILKVIDYFCVPSTFTSKSEPSLRDFFEKIIEDEKKIYSKEEFEKLRKDDKIYVDDESGHNLLQLYLNNEGIMKK